MERDRVNRLKITESAGKAGEIDGLTILRFAHAYDAGGGTERYLDDLDHALLDRNKISVIRLHLTHLPERQPVIEEAVGRGRLIRIALPVIKERESAEASSTATFKVRVLQQARSAILYNPVVWNTVGAKWTRALSLGPRPGEAIGAGAVAREVFESYGVDLVVMHFFGGADAGEVLEESASRGIPAVLVHHYSNDRLLHLANRKHIMQADAVAGVNGMDLPRFLKGRFTNVSDGVDTEFFSRENARPLKKTPQVPTILLPARLTREKGQLDLIRAVKLVQSAGIECGIALAGRIDDLQYVAELRREIEKAQMKESVQFLGALQSGELRDWYAASGVLAFPTYHHEGLPRIIIEAQAMALPVVAYNSGGIAEGIISGKTGYLVRVGDIEGMAQRLKELLSSIALREEMGRQGRRIVESNFNLLSLAARHECLYKRAMGQKATIKSAAKGEKAPSVSVASGL